MTLAKLKASPFGVNDELTSVEMNILNDEIQNAADFVNGGSYALAGNISLTSSTHAFDFNCPVLFANIASPPLFSTGFLTTGGLASCQWGSGAEIRMLSGSNFVGVVGSTLSHAGGALFSGNVDFTSSVQFNDLAHPVIFLGTARHDGQVTFNGGANVAAGLFQIQSTTKPVFGSGLQLSSTTETLDCLGPAVFSRIVTLGSLASVLVRHLTGPDASVTIAAQTYDRVNVGMLTLARDYTLADAANGTEIIISMTNASGSGTNALNVKTSGGSTIVQMKYQVAGITDLAHLIVVGGVWTLFYFKAYAIT